MRGLQTVNPVDSRSRIPSVDRLLQQPEVAAMIEAFGRELVVGTVRRQLQAARRGGPEVWADPGEMSLEEALASDCRREIERLLERRPADVVNATGVIIHTNLGRAPLSAAARRAAVEAGGYVDLEFDASSGKRGSRHDHLAEILRRTTGADTGIAVNNNAAATMLALAAIGQGREVIVSRSEAVEIGGGFRIPDVLEQSGARLVEVGTTNRTYARDYANAITADTAAILKVHRSNFSISGFTHDPSLAELVQVGAEREVPVIHDLGSGALLDTAQYGVPQEPMVQASIAAGAALVTFSGDKLLGGPQAGIIAGREDAVATVKAHPLARALRIDKMTVAALHATLAAYLRGTATREIPVWQMISATADELRARTERWRDDGGVGEVVAGTSRIGGGSAPDASLPTWRLLVASGDDARRWGKRLRERALPIIGVLHDDGFYLDARTVLGAAHDAEVVQALRELRG